VPPRVYIAAVFSPAWFLFAQAGLVAVAPDAAPGCPSARQVEEALYARVPGAVIPFSEAERRDALQLTLAPLGADGRRQFSLVDEKGHPRLQRTLAASGGQANCAALAETVALIVHRYLTDLDDPISEPMPPNVPLQLTQRSPPVPERRWDLSLSTGWRVGSEAWGGLAVGPRAARLLGGTGRLLLVGAASLGGEAVLVPTGSEFRGTARTRQFPIELGLWLRTVGWNRAEAQAGVGGGLDLTRVQTRPETGAEDVRWLPGPVVFAAAALRLSLRGPTFMRLSGAAAGSVVTYRFSYRPQTSVDTLTIFSVPTRRFYVRIAADIGFTLR
jgi:hypothetical protein